MFAPCVPPGTERIQIQILLTLRQYRGEQRDIKDAQYYKVLCKDDYTLLFSISTVDGSKLHLKYLVKILEKEMYKSKDV